MDNDTSAGKPRPRRRSERIRELQSQIDERDEIIRQLNEALSRALDELTLSPKAA